jgi:hypothetical protein
MHRSQNRRQVGRVLGLWRYPVKSMGAAEDTWVGHVLSIGGMRMRIDKRDGRCVVITIDPVTSERNPAILRAVARDRQGCLGVYGSTVEPGRVAVNDPFSSTLPPDLAHFDERMGRERGESMTAATRMPMSGGLPSARSAWVGRVSHFQAP